MIQSDFPIPRLDPFDENFENLIDREDLTSREISEIRLYRQTRSPNVGFLGLVLAQTLSYNEY